MHLKCRIGRIAIAALNRCDDTVMFGQGGAIAAFGGKRGVGHQRHRAMHQIKLLHQKAVVAGQVDLLVKALVGPRKRTRVAAKQGLILGHHRAQHAQLFVGGMACG